MHCILGVVWYIEYFENNNISEKDGSLSSHALSFQNNAFESTFNDVKDEKEDEFVIPENISPLYQSCINTQQPSSPKNERQSNGTRKSLESNRPRQRSETLNSITKDKPPPTENSKDFIDVEMDLNKLETPFHRHDSIIKDQLFQMFGMDKQGKLLNGIHEENTQKDNNTQTLAEERPNINSNLPVKGEYLI